MRIQVNGEARDAPDSLTIRGLLDLLGIADQPVAVECNKHIVPRAEHASTRLQEGDCVELVQFVGGG
jgi:sulfur carrier protein